ncbi:hypothetical protein Tco_0895600 [Tanacetum coccineum]|uniref:Uncharacterized protein n=1 Tax=Tanacetum coccineum TaxID=301880 RepID=A0ABQ5CIA1_9ASTR
MWCSGENGSGMVARASAKATISTGVVDVYVVKLLRKNEEVKVVNDCASLKRCNPDTTVKIDVYGEEDPESPTRLFRRIYVCLGALKRGFREGGRELLGLDGAFMRGQYPGQMLTAVGSVDANNGTTLLLMGLLPALEKLFPHAEHRFLAEKLRAGPPHPHSPTTHLHHTSLVELIVSGIPEDWRSLTHTNCLQHGRLFIPTGGTSLCCWGLEHNLQKVKQATAAMGVGPLLPRLEQAMLLVVGTNASHRWNKAIDGTKENQKGSTRTSNAAGTQASQASKGVWLEQCNVITRLLLDPPMK